MQTEAVVEYSYDGRGNLVETVAKRERFGFSILPNGLYL
jgi:YD repeat-containing protein